MKKKISLLLILFLSILSIPVFAKTDNGLYAGQEVTLEKNLNTTSLVAGNNIEMTSEVDGLNFVAGNNISLSSTQDYLLAAGNNIQLKNITTKDAFIAGSLVNISSSNIRDLYVAAETIRIDSDISRNAYIAGDSVTINGTIDGNVNISASDIRIGKQAIINGTLKYPEEANVSISDTAQIHKTKTYVGEEVRGEFTTNVVVDFIISYLSLLVIGFILMAIDKKLYNKIEEQEKDGSSIAKTSLLGLAILILLPIIVILIMITVIGIPLSIISLMIYGILIYLSTISTAYYFGNWALKDKIQNKYLLLAVSLLVIYLLKTIPIIGGWVAFLSLIFGLGMYAKLIKEKSFE